MGMPPYAVLGCVAGALRTAEAPERSQTSSEPQDQDGASANDACHAHRSGVGMLIGHAHGKPDGHATRRE